MLGFQAHKVGCDTDFVIQFTGACVADNVIQAVAGAGIDPAAFHTACIALAGSIGIGLNTSLGHNAYQKDQCDFCDCLPRFFGQPGNGACLIFSQDCPFDPIFGEEPCPTATQEDIDLCEAVWGPGSWDEIACMCRNPITPLLIDLNGNGFHLTDAQSGVAFDFNGDGTPERSSWTRPGTLDAFLALDRNENGRVDNGSELFGNWTPQPNTPMPHGFTALEQYDHIQLGGNADGLLTAADSVFGDLLLWNDANHDGRSQRRELTPLENSGILEIQLDYNESRRNDEFGNLFRYYSHARDGRGRRFLIVDVFFVGRSFGNRECRFR